MGFGIRKNSDFRATCALLHCSAVGDPSARVDVEVDLEIDVGVGLEVDVGVGLEVDVGEDLGVDVEVDSGVDAEVDVARTWSR